MLTSPLHSYQNPLVDKFLARGNLLLAADMGTGKTICAIAGAESLLGDGTIDCCMILCPPGLKIQWAKAIAQFTDVPARERRVKDQTITVPHASHCLVISGDQDRRDLLYRQLEVTCPEYVIIGHDTILSDWSMVQEICPGMIVLDEASVIKNPQAQRSQAMKQLYAEHRLALTGTAVENKPEDIFSIMEWVDATVLGNAEMFDKSFITRNKWGKPVRYKNMPTLNKKLSKAMGRITVDDPEVAPFMPTRERHLWEVEMDERTKETYDAIAEHLLNELEINPPAFGNFDAAAHYAGRPDESTPDGRAMAMQQAMQMLLNHPRLLEISAQQYADGVAARAAGSTKKDWPGSKFAHELREQGWLEDLDVSFKLAEVTDKVCAILEEDPANKVIIFSGYRGMLPLLAEALGNYGSVQYHGQMSGQAKAASQAAFLTDPSVRLMLTSNAGAYGLDLPVANWLINYDLDWSHGKQSQKDRRHVRASSIWKHVNIADVVTAGSVEARRLSVVNAKGRVARAVVDGKGHDRDGMVEAGAESLTEHLSRYLRRPRKRSLSAVA